MTALTQARRSWLALAAALANACAPTANPCACSPNEFCCIDHCLPLGSTCGPTFDPPKDDGGTVDAGTGGDAGVCDKRARPDGGTAVVTSYCSGDSQVSCLNSDVKRCAANRRCLERYDSVSRLFIANCIPRDGEPCAGPARECQGSFIVECQADPARDPDGPPFIAKREVNCAADSPGAVCVKNGATPSCQKLSCDPSAVVDHCEGDAGVGCDSLSNTPYVEPCSADYMCASVSPLKLYGKGTLCVRSNATPYGTATAESCASVRFSSCVHDDIYRVESCGYAWQERCDLRPITGPRYPAECYALNPPL